MWRGLRASFFDPGQGEHARLDGDDARACESVAERILSPQDSKESRPPASAHPRKVLAPNPLPGIGANCTYCLSDYQLTLVFEGTCGMLLSAKNFTRNASPRPNATTTTAQMILRKGAVEAI